MRRPCRNSSSTRTIRSCSSFSVASTPSAAPPANATRGRRLAADLGRRGQPARDQAQPDAVAQRLLLGRVRVRADESLEPRVQIVAGRGRVQAADQRAHAVADDAVDPDVGFLQRGDRADVRDARRAADGQHQARPPRLHVEVRRLLVRAATDAARACARTKDEQHREGGGAAGLHAASVAAAAGHPPPIRVIAFAPCRCSVTRPASWKNASRVWACARRISRNRSSTRAARAGRT